MANNNQTTEKKYEVLKDFSVESLYEDQIPMDIFTRIYNIRGEFKEWYKQQILKEFNPEDSCVLYFKEFFIDNGYIEESKSGTNSHNIELY